LVDIPMALDMSVSSAVFGWETKVAAQFNLVETAAAALGAALVLLVGRVWRRSKETARRREPVTQPVSEPLIAELQPREQERVLAE
jgi:hypothetical protein